MAYRRCDESLRTLRHNDDDETLAATAPHCSSTHEGSSSPPENVRSIPSAGTNRTAFSLRDPTGFLVNSWRMRPGPGIRRLAGAAFVA